MTETSIGVSKETKRRLNEKKTHKRETYDDVILRLLGEMND